MGRFLGDLLAPRLLRGAAYHGSFMNINVVETSAIDSHTYLYPGKPAALAGVAS
jgi:hypothetical protein